MSARATLPDKPSELLMVALKDLEWVEKSPDYVVRMSDWHQPNGKCAVCLGGSVMARTLGADASVELCPDDFPESTAAKLGALDYFRGGWLHLGLGSLNIDRPDSVPRDYAAFTDDFFYAKSRDEWWLHMQTIVGVLQAEGL